MERSYNETYEKLHKKSENNKELLKHAHLCGCFYCKNMYTPSKIHEWVDRGVTALCVFCGIDSVIPLTCGDPDNASLLDGMGDYWFSWAQDQNGNWVYVGKR